MQAIEHYSLQELKQIYQLLQKNIMEEPFLMDSQLLSDLQQYLQQQASQDGVDISLHGEWAAWLNGLFVMPASAQ